MEPQTIFVYISSFTLAVIAYLIPKKLKLYDIYATSMFAALFGLLVDAIIALKYQFYVLDKPGIQIPALIGQVVMYSSTSIILLNFYPFGKSVKKKLIYILSFTLITIVFEFICYKVGFIKYNEWKMWHSVLSYPFLIYLLVLHYKFFRWLVERSM
ncbi:CBO0543 family protein [Mesobacillus maritimus]|uniref:CBO0543 family protein n=1 Tax=Mesobacillus maritimus TaxID=1643336 RepID=UPI00384A7C7E